MIAIIILAGFIAVYCLYEYWAGGLDKLQIRSWESLYGVRLRTGQIDRTEEVTRWEFHVLAHKYGTELLK